MHIKLSNNTGPEDNTSIIVGALVFGFLLIVGVATGIIVVLLAVKYYKLRVLSKEYSVPDSTLGDHYEDMSKINLEEGIYDTVDSASITDDVEEKKVYQGLLLDEVQNGSYAHIYNRPRKSNEDPPYSSPRQCQPPPRVSRYASGESPPPKEEGSYANVNSEILHQSVPTE